MVGQVTLGERGRKEEAGEGQTAAVSNRFALAWQFALAPDVVVRSFFVGVIVGTLLNLINQGDVLWELWESAELNGLKLVLTYMVPYGVATYGSVSARLWDHKGGHAT